MKKKYVSNSAESTRMFKSDFLEQFSKTHFTVPMIVYLPVVAYFSYKAFMSNIGVASYLLFFGLGFLTWTFAEYILHRYLFHWVPKSAIGLRLHFVMHGVHHDYPKDAKRLVMPLSISLPLAFLFYYLLTLCFQIDSHRYADFAGLVLGYVTYDTMHYAIHHFNFKSPFFKRIQQHHILHHYDDPTKGYGVSSVLWDIVFGSTFTKKRRA